MKKILLVAVAILSLQGCSDSKDQLSEFKSDKVVITPAYNVKTRASKIQSPIPLVDNEKTYNIQYKDINIQNVPLRDPDVSRLQAASSISSPILVSVNGYSKWTVRTEGHKGGDWYKMSFSSKDENVKRCGISPGIYIVRDVWFWQTYTLPTPLAIVFNNNDYPDYSKMGRNPDNLSAPGFKWSLSGTEVTLKTAGVLIKYNLSGAEIFYTYPVKAEDLEWNFYYIKVG